MSFDTAKISFQSNNKTNNHKILEISNKRDNLQRFQIDVGDEYFLVENFQFIFVYLPVAIISNRKKKKKKIRRVNKTTTE